MMQQLFRPERLFISVCLLLLVACIPAMNIVAGSNDGSKLSLSVGTTNSVTFEVGEQDAEEVALYIGGTNLVVTDEKCQPVENGIGCVLGTIAAGQSYQVVVQGSRLSTNVTYYHPDSARPFLLIAETK
jgi:hypothetical protein